MVKENYNLLEKLLHYIALNNNSVSEFIYDLENKIYNKKIIDYRNNQHIFISGLARSGSTLLLNLLYNSIEYCSLTYNDMPFILAPNLWSKIFKNSQKNTNLAKRAHNDLIKININSPESFEEVFWKMMLENKYIAKKNLIKIKITKQQIEKFNNFINLICLEYQKKNYLSKNNNSILRIEDILAHFNNSFFIIPFRHPVHQANSLLNQHIRFKKIQLKNKFIKNYMNWLGHYEFGLNHLSFKLENLNQTYNKDSTNYWLLNWIHYYSYVLKFYNNSKNNNRIIFINYEKVCALKYNYLNKLEKKLNLKINLKNIEIISNNKQTEKNYENNLFKKALLIYEQIDSLCI